MNIDFEIASEDERPPDKGRYGHLLPDLTAGKTIFIPGDETRRKVIRNGLTYVAAKNGLRLTIRKGVRRGRDGLYIWARDETRRR